MLIGVSSYRFSLFLLCLALVFTQDLSAQNTQSSNDKVSDSSKPPFKTLLQQLESQYRVGFIYEPDVIAEKTSTIALSSDLDLNEVLARIEAVSPLQFIQISADTYVIKELEINTAKVEIAGQVRSEADGMALPGVTVLIDGTNAGTVTDINGKYSIQLNPTDTKLTYSYLGYKKQELFVDQQAVLNVAMIPDQTQLSEVVVTATGLDRQKKELGYSVHNVSTDDVINSHESNLVSAISAKAAGVQVISSSGSPGASADIRIRGHKSINSTNSPLFVLDGMLISNTTSGNTASSVDVSNRAIDINPYDIKKITILKGPAATVLFGSRAANGAVMITTHRGIKGKPVINFSSEFGVSEVNRLPPKQNIYAQGRPRFGAWTYRGPETNEAYSFGPLISELEFDGDGQYPYDKNGRLVAAGQGNGVPAKAYDDYGSFWVRGNRFDNNLSITGGSEAVSYYFSFGHLKESGIVPGADFGRTSLKANVDFELNDRMSLGVSTSLVNSGGKRTRRGSTISGVTIGLFRNTPTFDIGNGSQGKSALNDPLTYQLPDKTQRAYRANGSYDNPFWSVAKNPYEDNVNRIISTVNTNIELLSWLSLVAKVGFDSFTDSRDFAWDVNSASEPRGRVDQVTRISRRINTDVYLNMDKRLTDWLTFQGTLGHNYYSQNFETKSSAGRQFSVAGFFDISNATDVSSDRSLSRSKLAGVFVDLNMIYKDFLFLHFAGRNDWSSRLPKNNNSFFYSAASVGFELMNAFKHQSDIVNRIKLRGSFGQVGNAPQIYQTQDFYRNSIIDGDGQLQPSNFPAFGINAFERSGRKGNDNLRPELTTTLELGGDFVLFDNRLSMDFTYYRAVTSSALVTITVPAPSGYTSIVRNTGEMQNKGIEFALQGKLIDNSHWSWNISMNFTRNRSLVKSLAPDVDNVSLASFSNISSLNIPGQAYGVFNGNRYSYDSQGRLLIGSDGYPLVDAEHGFVGDPNPDWTAGISNQIAYKQFSLSFLWDIRMGGDLWNGTKAVMNYHGISQESADQRNIRGYVFDGVHENGEVNTTPIDFANPQNGLSGILWRKYGFLGVAEEHIEDGSWARLRELSITYELPKKIIDRLPGFSKIALSVYGRNLLLYTNYTGIDPETNLRGPSNAKGWDYFNLPNTKSYGIVLKARIN
ncbi:MAG: SusC/RagA family TonB-linked outer membrane protein [Reichenbachiella sp.]|uniref:SusC/RagA family TonB-linked outer membrane protein n=1 Tax=Reichenbachiella sp. TaxID=2184521 RepID=UPI003265DBA0